MPFYFDVSSNLETNKKKNSNFAFQILFQIFGADDVICTRIYVRA